MLPYLSIEPTIPTSDLESCRKFYEETLGFQATSSDAQGVIYEGADGSRFRLFPSSGKPSGSHTQMSLNVGDIEATARDLKSKGVRFEDVDMPGYDPRTSIATMDEWRGAWFKDPEGNLLAIFEERPAQSGA